MTRFVTSDPHFFHKNILNFTDKDGVKIRPYTTLDEMHSAMISNWNQVVRPNDKVYVLGDLLMAYKERDAVEQMKIFNSLNGKKSLILGNHDIFNLRVYQPYFDNIRAYRIFNTPKNNLSVICSHIPVHPCSQGRFAANIHGHLHDNQVMYQLDEYSEEIPDPFYINACVERNNFTPVNLDELLSKIDG